MSRTSSTLLWCIPLTPAASPPPFTTVCATTPVSPEIVIRVLSHRRVCSRCCRSHSRASTGSSTIRVDRMHRGSGTLTLRVMRRMLSRSASGMSCWIRLVKNRGDSTNRAPSDMFGDMSVRWKPHGRARQESWRHSPYVTRASPVCEQPPTHLKPGSTVHALEQPSPDTVLLSSHSSAPNLLPSPHTSADRSTPSHMGFRMHAP